MISLWQDVSGVFPGEDSKGNHWEKQEVDVSGVQAA